MVALPVWHNNWLQSVIELNGVPIPGTSHSATPRDGMRSSLWLLGGGKLFTKIQGPNRSLLWCIRVYRGSPRLYRRPNNFRRGDPVSLVDNVCIHSLSSAALDSLDDHRISVGLPPDHPTSVIALGNSRLIAAI